MTQDDLNAYLASIPDSSENAISIWEDDEEEESDESSESRGEEEQAARDVERAKEPNNG